jgi:DNA invertase Pin-like site-specific DNA recombinase
MKRKLKKGDLLIVKSIDRLGRNYEMIIQEWQSITKVIEADILVLDFPLLDTRIENENLVGRFISDIVLQVLSFVAQNERENIRKRQAEGIRIAKAKGIHMGRPRMKLPDNFKDIVDKYHNKQITNVFAAKTLNMSRTTFLKYSKLYKEW